jgi:hypothetical protein
MALENGTDTVPKRRLKDHQFTLYRTAEERKSLAGWTKTYGEVRGRRPAKSNEDVKLTFRPQIENLFLCVIGRLGCRKPIGSRTLDRHTFKPHVLETTLSRVFYI